jgi:hypothetical protein
MRIIPGALTEVYTSAIVPLGTRHIDKDGNEYRFVKFGVSATAYAQYHAVVMTTTWGVVTNDYDAALALTADQHFAGVVMSSDTITYLTSTNYGWIQTHGTGYAVADSDFANLDTGEAWMIGAGNEDGQVAVATDQTTIAYTKIGGIALADATGDGTAFASTINSLIW